MTRVWVDDGKKPYKGDPSAVRDSWLGRFQCWRGHHKEILIVDRGDDRWECRRPHCDWKNYSLGGCCVRGVS